MTPDFIYTWPLILVIVDCYVPASARLVLEVAHEYDSEELVGLMWRLAGMDAVEEMRGRLN